MKNFKTFIAGVAFFTLASVSLKTFANVDTIRLKDKRLNTVWLKPGLNQYLIYYQNPKESKSLRFWFWIRNIQIQNKNGEAVFAITQHWYGSDSSHYRFVYSLNKAVDFAPVYHKEEVNGSTSAYNWTSGKVQGADSVTANVKRSFLLNFNEANFNWNLDIETLEMLPWAKGKTFAINFYDAGLDPPKYILYKVTGSETLRTLDYRKVDCWKVSTEGVSGEFHYTQTFWISKATHEFLKEESAFNGTYAYKMKLMGSATNLLDRFSN